jgi:hypothetical protein
MDKTDLYTSIVLLNRAAADARQFEVAYHLLAAALHAAEVSGDKNQIEEVILLAGQQGSAVDAAPNHPLSTVNARKRGNTPLYSSLIAMARGKLERIDSQRAMQKHRASANQEVIKDDS